MKMSPAQCRTAREVLRLSLMDLAHRARVTAGDVIRFENGENVEAAIATKVQAVLEAAGAEFGNYGGVHFQTQGLTVPSR
jgi:predicted transcriptional regulator